MGGFYRQQDVLAEIRRMQEQIRRLQTRIPEGELEPWTYLGPFLNNSTNYPASFPTLGDGYGWYSTGATEDDFDQARYYRHDGRVYFAGLVQFFGDDDDLPGLDVIARDPPDGYEPDRLTNLPLHADPDNTTSGTMDQWWMCEFMSGGVGDAWMWLDPNPNFPGSPTFGAPPQLAVLNLAGANYRHQ